MNTNVGQNNGFLGQVGYQALNPELEALRKFEEENNPSIKKLQHDLSQSKTVIVAGDQFVPNAKKEEKTGFLDRFASLFGKDSDEDDDTFAQISAYDELIPMAKINKTLKEYELMQKAFAEV